MTGTPRFWAFGSSFNFSIAAAVATAGCTSPADVAGSYSVDITDEANGCGLAGFTQGQTASAIPVTITQSSASITIAVTGLVGVFIQAGLGSDTFTGTVSGDSFTATLVGTTTMGSAGCAYTLDADVAGTLNTDSIAGTITYRAVTNNSGACGTLTGCASVQDYTGSRPPP
jgi:hypothetical protein